jgi:tyrosyl-tRNA synthetase
MPIKEIDEADKAMKAGANPKDFKVRLATEVLTMYHGADAAAQAVDEFANIFKKGGTPDEMPEFKMSGDRNVIDLLELCKLIATRAEGKRLVEQGGLEIDGERVTDKNAVIHLKAGMVIKAGKRKFAKII